MVHIRQSALFMAIAVAACAGPRLSPSPLFLASVEGTGEASQARVHVEDNTVVITGSLAGGCRPSAGEYIHDGHAIEVRLTGAGTSCQADPGHPTYTTRVGPLPPGNYQVTVTLDGTRLLSHEPARIG